ncbi:MAG TPA: TonB family protein [Candidatus Acidoferrum sp.]|nr:TonB family protein [Candidatus Acidoferrum sp.]
MNVLLAKHHLGSKRIILVTLAGAIVVLLAGSTAGLIPHLYAQNKKSGREVIHSVKPEYPVIMKSARIGGTVRMNATVLANGTVARVQVLGGNPILAETAAKAVMRWKFALASTQTNEEVVVNFNSNEAP